MKELSGVEIRCHPLKGTRSFHVSELFRNQRGSCCLSGWIGCYGDRYRSSLFMIEQKDKVKRCKGVQEYVTLNVLNVETRSKAKSQTIL